MDTKHTPGPWRINAVMREYGNKLEIAHEEISVTSVTVAGKGNKTSITPEQEANARLIAAAPDLLAALEAMVSAKGFDQEAAALIKASEALAKAKGV